MAEHRGDKYGPKAVEKIGDLQEKAQGLTGNSHKDNEDKQPAGGFDDTPIPNAPPGFTIRITFHRAENLPFSDFPSLSTDAYIHATLKTGLQKRHKQDPDLFIRTPTIHRNTNPHWETQWVIAHVPASGFFLKCRLYDEDPTDHDDRLGNVHVNVNNIGEGWDGIKKQTYEIKKRMGSKRAYTLRGIAALVNKSVSMHGRLILSVENLGHSPGVSGGRAYTVSPLTWSRHHSPLIGRIAGTKSREKGRDGKKSTTRYNFQAVQMQLRGPVPEAMYHRYVEFKPFIAGMFTDVSLRGRILNRALHHQHARIYNYDSTTIYGVYENPCIEMTKQLLEFCHYDQGGRIYTYVLSLDGLFRFTETGKEFGIDMLSKHTMHSDVSIYIAFSGEFFIRRIKHAQSSRHSRGASDASNASKASKASAASNSADRFGDVAPPATESEDEEEGHPHHKALKDPRHYELIIDNDSGTYRPNAKLLPQLKNFFEVNFPGLRVATMDSQADAEIMKKLKEEQRDFKKHTGKQMTYLQNSSASSFSSSDEEDLDLKASGQGDLSGFQKQKAKLQNKLGNMSMSKDEPDQARQVSTGQTRHPPSHDSRDYTSDASGFQTNGSSSSNRDSAPPPIDITEAEKNIGGYDNKDLPELMKHDADGEIPRPSGDEMGKENGGGNTAYAQLETGENKPAGGIVYGQVVSTAQGPAPTRKQRKESKRGNK